MGLSTLIQFFVMFVTHIKLGRYNSIENLYLPAKCGTERLLKPGVLLRAVVGNFLNIILVRDIFWLRVDPSSLTLCVILS